MRELLSSLLNRVSCQHCVDDVGDSRHVFVVEYLSTRVEAWLGVPGLGLQIDFQRGGFSAAATLMSYGFTAGKTMSQSLRMSVEIDLRSAADCFAVSAMPSSAVALSRSPRAKIAQYGARSGADMEVRLVVCRGLQGSGRKHVSIAACRRALNIRVGGGAPRMRIGPARSTGRTTYAVRLAPCAIET